MSDVLKEYWNNFCKEKQIDEETEYDAWSFGNTKRIVDELADLVDKRIKTATTSAYEL